MGFNHSKKTDEIEGEIEGEICNNNLPKVEALQAYAKLQVELPVIVKNSKVKFFTKNKGAVNYTYAPLSEILSVVLPKVAEYNFVVTVGQKEIGVLSTKLIHTPTGEVVAEDFAQLPITQNFQERGSAISYSRRYSLLLILNLATADDDGITTNKQVQNPCVYENPPIQPTVNQKVFDIGYWRHYKQQLVQRAVDNNIDAAVMLDRYNMAPAWQVILKGEEMAEISNDIYTATNLRKQMLQGRF